MILMDPMWSRPISYLYVYHILVLDNINWVHEYSENEKKKQEVPYPNLCTWGSQWSINIPNMFLTNMCPTYSKWKTKEVAKWQKVHNQMTNIVLLLRVACYSSDKEL